MELSFSQINMLLRCSRQYEFRYVKGLKIPPAGVMLQGSAYHEALATNFNYKIRTGDDMKLGDVLDAFNTAWTHQLTTRVTDHDEEFDDIQWGGDPGALKDEGVDLVREYRQTIAPDICPLKVEHKIRAEIQEDLKIVGILDLETVDLTIIDHKVKKVRMSIDEVNRDLQATIYALLQANETKEDLLVKGTTIEFHTALRKIRKIEKVTTVRRLPDVEWVREKIIKKAYKQIKSGLFIPNPTGWWCSERFCGYWSLCHERA